MLALFGTFRTSLATAPKTERKKAGRHSAVWPKPAVTPCPRPNEAISGAGRGCPRITPPLRHPWGTGGVVLPYDDTGSARLRLESVLGIYPNLAMAWSAAPRL